MIVGGAHDRLHREMRPALQEWSLQMKAFLLGCAAAIVIAIAAMAILNQVQEPVEQAFATTGVRL